MSWLRFLAALLLAAPLAVLAQGKAVVTTSHVRAELLAHAPQGLQPGQPAWLGLQIEHQPGWHTYWKNSGDSGLPTELKWTLPQGLTAGEIAWPLPRKIPVGNLANYGYEDRILLPVPLTVARGFKPDGDVEIRLHASWLVCQKECVPEEGDFTLRLPAQGSTAMNGQAFEQALAAQPRPVLTGTGGAIPDSTAQITGQALAITVQGLPVALRGRTLEFFPETAEVIETGAKWTQAWNGAAWTASVPLSAHRNASPAVMPVVLAAGNEGWRTELKVTGTWPAVAPPPALQAAPAVAAGAPVADPIGWGAALLGALLGGLILNLMPCVFPVLAIKVIGFSQHAGDRRRHRVAGLAYAAGVVLSFLALGGLMLALRAAGEQLGWGFQLQSPGVVAALAALFTLVGLNFAGLFEFGSLLPSRVATLQARHPVLDSFLAGVLAVAVASPCTAPFMGASLGFAIGLPAPQALALFAAVGAGMALPYLMASWLPAAARLLPRPGAWMELFRRLMAFPMFATVAWLVWVLGQQSGIDGAAALLLLLVALAMLVWSLGQRGQARAVLGGLALVTLGLLGWAAGPYMLRTPAVPSAAADGPWQPWTAQKAEQILASGQPVFVDFTAAWCVTCQYNKKTTLSEPAVLADLQARKVALLRADWTRRDPAITDALARLGRNGVPVYVLQAPGRPPVVLSEILGKAELRAALARL